MKNTPVGLRNLLVEYGQLYYEMALRAPSLAKRDSPLVVTKSTRLYSVSNCRNFIQKEYRSSTKYVIYLNYFSHTNDNF